MKAFSRRRFMATAASAMAPGLCLASAESREEGGSMYTAADVSNALEAIAPRDSGVPGDELGIIHGAPETEVRGVACMWNVHARSIERAAAAEANMIICHEGIWLPAQQSPWYDGPAKEEITGNRLRRGLLDRFGMVVYRSHSNWDALAHDGVPDQAVEALGLPGLRIVASQRFFKVHALNEPISLAALRQHAAKGLGFPQCRLFGDPGRLIQRFAFLIGGFGENQFHMPQAAHAMGAEAIIIGEMSEFIVIAALEMGLAVIETLHSASESPAIRRQAEMLGKALPGLPVHYVPSGAMAYMA